MAVNSTNSVSGYTIGGKPLGVQLGQKSGTALFGDTAASTSSLFSANLIASSAITIDSSQIAISGIQNQIDRLQGYRINLSPTEKEQLTEYQTKIIDINQIATGRILTDDEVTERAEAYIESYKILGKEYQDFSSDSFITEQSDALTELLATKPTGAEASRLERLQNVYDSLVASANDRDTDPPDSLVAKISSIYRQISQLTTPRPISSLKPDELRQHDELVEAINNHAGFEVELTSTTKLQIERLQKTIETIQQGGAVYA